MTPAAMIRVTAIMAMTLVAAVTTVGLGYFSGPVGQEKLFPVLSSELAGPVVRTASRVCWPMRQTKLRDGAPEYVSYFVTYGRGARVAVTPYIEATGELVASPSFTRHPPGDVWVTHYCIDLPPPIASAPDKAIEGTIYYRVPHGLWTVPAQQPRVAID